MASIEAFAEQHGFRLRRDDDAVEYVPGRSGMIYINEGKGQALYTDPSFRRWKIAMHRCEGAGVAGGPRGDDYKGYDYEIVGELPKKVAPEEILWFDPADPGQTAAVVGAIRPYRAVRLSEAEIARRREQGLRLASRGVPRE